MLLLVFVFLQVMDAITTLLFLHHGVSEANPLIRALLGICRNPGLALAAPKIFAVLLAFYGWRSGRHQLLRRINVLFAFFVGWNLLAIAVQR